MHDMQAQPLFISITAEKGRDELIGVITEVIEKLLDINPHLSVHKIDTRETEHTVEQMAWLRVSKEAEQ